MTVYLFIFFLVLLAYLYKRKYDVNKHQNLQILGFIIFILWFVSAFRAENIGTDHPNYNLSFYQIGITGDDYFSEKGYVLLNHILYFIWDDPIILSITVTSLLIFSYAKYVQNFVPMRYWIFAILIFAFQPYLYIQTTFNAMRQCCATAFVIFSIPALINRRWLKFILILALGWTFHHSALFFILLIIVRTINITPKKIIVFAVIVLSLNLLGVFHIFFDILNSYQVYKKYEESVLNIKPYVLFIFCTMLYFTTKYYELYKNETEKFFIDIFLLSLGVLIIAVQNDILYRIYMIFAFLSVPGIAIICKNLYTKTPIIENLFVMYYCCFYIGYASLWVMNNDRKYYPFEFVFFN